MDMDKVKGTYPLGCTTQSPNIHSPMYNSSHIKISQVDQRNTLYTHPYCEPLTSHMTPKKILNSIKNDT